MFHVPEDGFIKIAGDRIEMWSESEGPWATLTVPGIGDMKKGVFGIKDWSENEGVFNWMMEHGFIRNTLGFVPSGFVSIRICEVDVDKMCSWKAKKGCVSS